MIAAAQVFATSLDAYFQLTIMLMVLIIGFALLAHYQPFEDPSSQATQVSAWLHHAETSSCVESLCHVTRLLLPMSLVRRTMFEEPSLLAVTSRVDV